MNYGNGDGEFTWAILQSTLHCYYSDVVRSLRIYRAGLKLVLNQTWKAEEWCADYCTGSCTRIS